MFHKNQQLWREMICSNNVQGLVNVCRFYDSCTADSQTNRPRRIKISCTAIRKMPNLRTWPSPDNATENWQLKQHMWSFHTLFILLRLGFWFRLWLRLGRFLVTRRFLFGRWRGRFGRRGLGRTWVGRKVVLCKTETVSNWVSYYFSAYQTYGHQSCGHLRYLSVNYPLGSPNWDPR